jgi:hypothetical protein
MHCSVTRRGRLNDRGGGCRTEDAFCDKSPATITFLKGAALAAAKSREDSSNQAPRDLACSGGGNGTLLVLRRTRCCFGPNPKPDSQIRRPDELDSCVFKCPPNLLNGIKVGLDTTFRAFQPAYGRKSQSGFPGKLTLPPSQEGASCLDLSRVNEHFRPHRS